MREELLAHLQAVFGEEMARLGDEQAALEQTARRFGNPTELSAQLQETVPISDSVGRLFDWLWYRPGESTLGRAIRHALLVDAFAGFFFFLFGSLILWKAGIAWPAEMLWLGGRILLVLGYVMFGFTFLTEWMRRAQYGEAGRSWRSVALVVVATFALILSVLPLGMWFGDGRSPGEDISSVVVVILTFVFWLTGGAMAIAHEIDARMRYHQEWANLAFEGESDRLLRE
jgi:hypothetical protein